MAQVYVVTNNVNGKRYVGLTKRGLDLRFKEHVWAALKGHKTHLYNAIRKYGASSFSIALLEETDHAAERERFYIASLSPEYNMTQGGDGVVMRSKRICVTDGVREWYIEADAKIPDGCRRGRLPSNVAKVAAANTGKTRSQEAKDRTAAKHRGMKRTPEQRLRMGRPKKVVMQSLS